MSKARKCITIVVLYMVFLSGCASKVLTYGYTSCARSGDGFEIRATILGVLRPDARPMEYGAPYFLSVEVEGVDLSGDVSLEIDMHSAGTKWAWQESGDMVARFSQSAGKVIYYYDAYDLSIPYEDFRVSAVVKNGEDVLRSECTIEKYYEERRISMFDLISLGV